MLARIAIAAACATLLAACETTAPTRGASVGSAFHVATDRGPVLVTAGHVADGCERTIRVIATDAVRDVAIAEPIAGWSVLALEGTARAGGAVRAGAAHGGAVIAETATVHSVMMLTGGAGLREWALYRPQARPGMSGGPLIGSVGVTGVLIDRMGALTSAEIAAFLREKGYRPLPPDGASPADLLELARGATLRLECRG
jgi:hypothetical protein